jgi:hypothetical protein
MSPRDTIGFESDDANATIQGHRYPGFFHDGDRSLVLTHHSRPCALLGYLDTGLVPYVVQLQGSSEHRPPKGWEYALLERFAQQRATKEPAAFVVQSGKNNIWATDFHAYLLEMGIYAQAGLGTPSFSEAMRFGPSERQRLSELFLEIPEDERIIAHLHPSTAFVRYDGTARRFARSNGSHITVLDEALAERFNGLVGDLLISRSLYH